MTANGPHHWRVVRITLLPSAIVLVFALVAVAGEPGAGTEPPATFLQTRAPALRHILATKITGDFHAAPIREVIQAIGRQSHANIDLSLDAPKTSQVPGSLSQAGDVPKINRRFQGVPLRMVLFQIGQDTGLKIDWVYENGTARAIGIRN